MHGYCTAYMTSYVGQDLQQSKLATRFQVNRVAKPAHFCNFSQNSPTPSNYVQKRTY